MDNLPVHYRYEDGCHNSGDYAFESPPRLMKYNAMRETRCGYWLRTNYCKDKWVSKTSRIRFAYPTEEEAKDSYLIRKQRQIQYAKDTIKRATYFLDCLGEKPWEQDWLSFSYG